MDAQTVDLLDRSMLSLVSCKCFLSSLERKGLFRSRFFFAIIFEGDSSLPSPEETVCMIVDEGAAVFGEGET